MADGRVPNPYTSSHDPQPSSNSYSTEQRRYAVAEAVALPHSRAYLAPVAVVDSDASSIPFLNYPRLMAIRAIAPNPNNTHRKRQTADNSPHTLGELHSLHLQPHLLAIHIIALRLKIQSRSPLIGALLQRDGIVDTRSGYEGEDGSIE